MHNLKDIRKDFTVFAKSLEKRSINLDVKNLQKLDEENRQLIQKKETLEKEKKDSGNWASRINVVGVLKFSWKRSIFKLEEEKSR